MTCILEKNGKMIRLLGIQVNMFYQVKRAIDFDLKVEQWSYGMALSYYRGIDVCSLQIAKKWQASNI